MIKIPVWCAGTKPASVIHSHQLEASIRYCLALRDHSEHRLCARDRPFGSPGVLPTVAPTLAGIIPLLGLAFPPILADPLLQTAIAAAAQSYLAFGPLPGYGMCGGMAWSSLDYWLAKSQLPSGATRFGQPQHTPASQAAVRDMIWQRLIDSLTTGGALSKTLEWSLILNQIPEVLVA